MNVTKAMQKTCLAAIAAAFALAAAAMPTRSELKKVQSVVNELMADDIAAMKSGRLKAPQVAANAEKLAGEAQSEAAKFLLYKGAFGLYVQGGSYDEAIRAIDRLTEAVKDVPDSVLAEILRDKLKRIPKKNGSTIFNLYDGVCRRMNAAKEREKLEKQVKAKPADKDARRLLAVRCAQAGDWKAAREHFAALGGDEAAAVKAETSDPAAAANFWWGFKPDDGEDDDTFREYAASLYRKAIADGSLAGLKLVLAKKRLAEVAPAAEQKTEQQDGETTADDAKREVAEKPRGERGEEQKPAARAAGGKRVDWSLPKNFKGKRFAELDLGNGETMSFCAMSCGFGYFYYDWQGQMPHRAKVTRPFWISQFPVTVKQCRPSGITPRSTWFEEKFAGDKDALVLAHVRISDVDKYFTWLNENFGSSLPKGWAFRPPTQGEATIVDGQGVQWMRKDKSWIDAIHSKGLFTDCQNVQDIARQCSMLGCSIDGLVIGAAQYRADRSIFRTPGYQVHLDRVFIPNVDVLSFQKKIYDAGLAPHLAKALNYQHDETDPFRYATGGEPHYTWVAMGQLWAPLDIPIPVLIRVAVGPDYVGEWRAKNGK